jgi:hypothetical protein
VSNRTVLLRKVVRHKQSLLVSLIPPVSQSLQLEDNKPNQPKKLHSKLDQPKERHRLAQSISLVSQSLLLHQPE